MAPICTNHEIDSINHSIKYLAKRILYNCILQIVNCSDHDLVILGAGMKLANSYLH